MDDLSRVIAAGADDALLAMDPANPVRPHARRVLVMHLEDPPGSGLTACTGAPLPIYPASPSVPFEACTGCTVLGPRLGEERAAHALALDALEEMIEGMLYTSAPGRYMVPVMAESAALLLASQRPQRWRRDASALVDLKGTKG